MATTTKKTAPEKVVKKKVTHVKHVGPSKDELNLPVLPKDKDEVERLVSMVPPKEVAEDYVHRTLPSGLTDFEFFELQHKLGKNVMLPGPTGSGKTMALMAYASFLRIPFGWLEGSRLARIEDVFGDYHPNEDDAKQLLFIKGDFALIFKYGGVYVIDEVNMILEGVSSKLFAAFDDRATIQLNNAKREKVRKSDATLVAACYNPGYAGGRPLNHALKRRFKHADWGYDRKVEETLLDGRVILEFAKKLRDSVGREIVTPLPTSSLVEFEEDVYAVLSAKADLNMAFAFARDTLLDQFDSGNGERVSARDLFDLTGMQMLDEYKNLYVGPDEEDSSQDEDEDVSDTEPSEDACSQCGSVEAPFFEHPEDSSIHCMKCAAKSLNVRLAAMAKTVGGIKASSPAPAPTKSGVQSGTMANFIMRTAAYDGSCSNRSCNKAITAGETVWMKRSVYRTKAGVEKTRWTLRHDTDECRPANRSARVTQNA